MSNLIRFSFLVIVGVCLLADSNSLETTKKANEKLVSKTKEFLNKTKVTKIKPSSTTRPTPKPVEDLVVKTNSGSVKGKVINLEYNPTDDKKVKQKQKVNAWLGIPYAEKPLDDLRFKHAVPKKSWPGVLDATNFPNSCYQVVDESLSKFKSIQMLKPTTKLSEDCLYLNIYAPNRKPKNASVIVYIHGGFFNTGSSTAQLYDPSIFVSESQQIFVTLNYRLNIFGFLYMDNENAPGNQGLTDQQVAIEWIHANIKHFGGDPKKITLMGQDAGAFSANLHAHLATANSFNNYILHSGSLFSKWASSNSYDGYSRGVEILNAIGCSGYEEQQIECAKKMNATTLIEKSNEYFNSVATHGLINIPFLPVVDKKYIPLDLNWLVVSKRIKKYRLVGSTKDNGNFNFMKILTQYKNLKQEPNLDYESFKNALAEIFYYYPKYPAKVVDDTLESIIDRYSNLKDANNSKINNFILDDAASDLNFICPTYNTFDFYYYRYYFTQRSSLSEFPEWFGVMHGDELPFVFGKPLLLNSKYTSAEKVLSRKMIKYWSNFARFDTPNGVKNSEQVERTSSLSQKVEFWENHFDTRLNAGEKNSEQVERSHRPEFSENFLEIRRYGAHTYMDMSAKEMQIKNKLRRKFCSFWGYY